ncbi:Na+/H+ antiporter subunit C [Candidatus Leptofilum sp.]|uniref:Na+/H+ antiporter subunit C n=1 Tax=Candidatus Leptofilum sp. TaxID=3241576 RepID=UPI003B5B4A71
MEIVMALIVGTLYAAGVYMIRRRSLVKLIIGLALIGHASNMLIFSMGDLVRGNAPLLHEGVDITTLADPLPQALILTAIVIGFGAQAFAIVLIRRVYQRIGTDDMDKITSTDRINP